MINRIKNRLVRTYHTVKYREFEKKVREFYLNKYSINNKSIDYLLSVALKNAIENVQFYNGYKPELAKFPIIDKSTYQKYGERLFLHKNSHLMGCYKMNTGGSTGEPFEFYRDVRTGIVDNIHQKYQHLKMGFNDNDKLIVFNGCDITKKNLDEDIYWNIKSSRELPFGSVEFSTHYLNINTIKYYLEKLISLDVSFVRAYPSAMCEFTSLLLQLGYKSMPFTLRGIQLSSEVCSDSQLKMLQEYWGKDTIYFQYGHSEAATIAAQYPGEDGYIFSPYYGLVEILDDSGKPVKKGEVGKVVVTSFHNFARPIIRYDTGDMALLSNETNSIVKVEKILGREQDYVVDKEGNKISVTSLVFGQHFKAFKNITNWQIVNDTKGVLHVKIIPSNRWNELNEKEIIDKLSFSDRFKVTLSYVQSIEKTKSGKNRLVIGECDE
ncbi:hypothetical protein AB6C49_11365 [Vibrio cyclitrophicus]